MGARGWDDGLDDRRLAHDVLQSVAILDALVGCEAGRGRTEEDWAEVLPVVAEELRVLARMCEGVLEEDLRQEEFSVAGVVTAAVERVRSVSAVPVEIEADGPELRLSGDEVAWGRAVYNLLENAVRAAGSGGAVRVAVRHRLGVLRVEVGDSGPGFGASEQGRASLGLTTVTRLVGRHGGQVEVGRSVLGGALVALVVPFAG